LDSIPLLCFIQSRLHFLLTALCEIYIRDILFTQAIQLEFRESEGVRLAIGGENLNDLTDLR
jgi:hypothetical protein